MVIGGGNPRSHWAVRLATVFFFSLCLDIVLTDIVTDNVLYS